MEFNFSALRSISLGIVAFTVVTHASAEAFGRFGYTSSPLIDGLKVDRKGVTADHPSADSLRFLSATSLWKPVQTTEFAQTIFLDGDRAWQPSKLKLSLTAPGASIYFPKGMKLKVSSTAAPYLTWGQGSAAPDVPTPQVKWIAVSFRDRQPPFVLGFPGQTPELTLTGQPGDWTISTPPEFAGWVRVGLPNGLVAEPTNSAAALGKLAKATAASEDIWSAMPPEQIGVTVESDADSVTATWKFDRPNALVPRVVSLSPFGEYPLRVQTPVRRLPFHYGDGPVEVTDGNELKVRLPIRLMPSGRSLNLGGPVLEPVGTVSPFDIPSMVELAVENLLGGRDPLAKSVASEANAEYVGQTAYFAEPWTNQQLPYTVDGTGIDLAAAHALLKQAMINASANPGEPNAFLPSVAWRRDWQTWLPAVSSNDLQRRTAALAAVAGALSSDPMHRLSGAMFQAGLSAERARAAWRRRSGIESKAETWLEPIPEIRIGLFRLGGSEVKRDPFIEAMFSPYRVVADERASLVEKDGAYRLQWPVIEPKAAILSLMAPGLTEVQALTNLPRFEREVGDGSTLIRYTPETAGIAEVLLILPDGAPRPSAGAPVPRYTEPRR